jgi:Ni/Fe-hydrogenase subunit HybB-like protein
MTDPILLSTFWDVFFGMLIFFFIFVPLVLLWVAALVDLFRRRGMSAVSRVLWLLFIVFFPVFGSLIYLLVRPPAEDVQYRY